MGKSQRDKGARYELEVVKALKAHGFSASRTAQHCGKPTKVDGAADNSDVIGLPGIHIECKHYANRGFDYKWLEQAIRDCGDNLPVVIHRIDRKPTVVTMTLEDFLELYKLAGKTPSL